MAQTELGPTAPRDRADLIRGPLRYNVSTSSPQLEAGRPFSVFVQVTNPYDVPAKVLSVTTKVPVEFVDINQIQREKQKEKLLERAERAAEKLLNAKTAKGDGTHRVKPDLRRELIRDLLRVLPFGSIISAGYTIAQVITASPAPDHRLVTERIEKAIDVSDTIERAEHAKTDEEQEQLYETAIRRIKEELQNIDNYGLAAAQLSQVTQLYTHLLCRLISGYYFALRHMIFTFN